LRPIQVTSAAVKIIERVLALKFGRELQARYPSNQFGFKSGTGTEEAAIRHANLLKEGLTSAVYYDLKSAFDTVEHEFLFMKVLV
jgi:hypothetical protein